MVLNKYIKGVENASFITYQLPFPQVSRARLFTISTGRHFKG